MDTKLIKQFDTEIHCYRLRTARRKKRMQYEDFDKQLIALSKEEHLLYRDKYNPEWEPLLPPVQRGWKRFFVLREDVARSSQAQFFENILTKINTQELSYRKDFKKKKRKFGRRIYVVRGQELKKPDEQEFKKMNFTDAEKEFFYAEFHYDQWKKRFIIRFAFTEPWRFVLRVRPNMIYKQKKIDTVNEARLNEIKNYIDRNGYRNRLHKIWYRHKSNEWKPYEREKEKYIFKNKSLHQLLDFIKEETNF
ncbi:MAG TPA: hypothetical protein VFW07_20655 [Parafilimonas sp.]|nr:hypothetical protein [Parafilimonas sp.]